MINIFHCLSLSLSALVTHTFFTWIATSKGMSLESKVFIWYMTLEHPYIQYTAFLSNTHTQVPAPQIQHAVVGYLPRAAKAGFDLLFLPGLWAGVVVTGALQGPLFVSPSAKRPARFRLCHRLWKTSSVVFTFCSCNKITF